ncbi:MAG: hypothetical protein P4L84_08775 [Isosphaeraceae bacterium]|nr:hypothetical protein [Isosphaeraceae bacterium]
MSTTRLRCRLVLEVLEERLALSAAHAASPTAPAQVESQRSAAAPNIPAGDTLTVLNEFVQAYLSRVGQPNYNPALDLNHNGQIGQDDGRLLLHALPPLSRKVPLNLVVRIAPQDKARGSVPTNLGGVTYHMDPTVEGHTTPGALIFTGSGVTDLKLDGPAVVADAQGNFSLKVKLSNGINQFDLEVVDAYGQQTLRAFPILWLGFSSYEAAHPRKT